MNFILGQKKEMIEVFSEDGSVHPATALGAGPATVTQIKTKDKDGYNAVQIGFGRKSVKRMKKPQQGYLKKIPNSKFQIPHSIRWFREFRVEEPEKFKEGDVIDASVFKEGDRVKVSAISKGKGFQGVVKRHGFAGGSRTRGQKHSEREAGSIGATWPQRVLKGKRMPGRMGGRRITVKNLEVLKVDPDKNLLLISGAVPGHRGTLVEIVKI
jgi:large subunit ribosomal protein L3